MPITRTKYECQFCGKAYTSEEQAIQCEYRCNRPLTIINTTRQEGDSCNSPLPKYVTLSDGSGNRASYTRRD